MSTQAKRLDSIGVSNIVQAVFWLAMLVLGLIIFNKFNPFISWDSTSNSFDATKYIKSPQFICFLVIPVLMLILFIYSLVIFLKSIFRVSNPFGIINCIINAIILGLIIVLVLVFVFRGIMPVVNDIKDISKEPKEASNFADVVTNLVNNLNDRVHVSCLATGLIGLAGFVGCGFSVMFCFISAAKTRS